MQKRATEVSPEIAQHKITRAEAASIMQKLAANGIENDAASYSAAKQIYYALDAFRTWLAQDGAKSAALDKAMDQMFSAVDATIKYDPEAMRAGLRSARAALRQMDAQAEICKQAPPCRESTAAVSPDHPHPELPPLDLAGR